MPYEIKVGGLASAKITLNVDKCVDLQALHEFFTNPNFTH